MNVLQKWFSHGRDARVLLCVGILIAAVLTAGFASVKHITIIADGKTRHLTTTYVRPDRVLQEAEPAAFQAFADETGFLPDGLFQLLAGVSLEAGDRTAKGGGSPPERNETFEETDQRNNRDRSVNNVISQIGQNGRDFR